VRHKRRVTRVPDERLEGIMIRADTCNNVGVACCCGAQVQWLIRGRMAQLTRRNSVAKSSVIDIVCCCGRCEAYGRRHMIVKAILAAKGGNVINIEPTATLETAVKTLAEHRIGALLVLGPDRRVMGILSERDIVRVLAERGASVLSQPLASVMTRRVVTCSQSDTVDVLMQRMTTGKFRHLPVVEQEQVIGVISIGDVVKHRVQEMEQESAALRDYIQTA
jgi:CBS domain-containing protein